MGLVRVGDVELWWQEQGAGAIPFVLVHGFTGSSDDWADVAPAVAEDRRVVVVDLRGHGRSTNVGRETDYGLDTLTEDLSGFLSAIGVPRCDLLGHSLGGMVALRHTLRRPETVRSLILMDTSAESVEGEGVKEFLTAQAELVRSQGMEALIAAADEAPLMGEDAAIAAEQGEELHRRRTRAKLEAMDTAALIGLTSVLCQHRGVTDLLGDIRCPTTVLVGADDQPFAASSRALAERIPGATLAVIPGAGHNPQKSSPADWLALVDAHLRRADRVE